MTNIDKDASVVRDLWRFVKEEGEDEDDGFGPAGATKPKKKAVERETLNFKLMMKMSGEACTSKTLNCAPVVHYEKSGSNNGDVDLHRKWHKM